LPHAVVVRGQPTYVLSEFIEDASIPPPSLPPNVRTLARQVTGWARLIALLVWPGLLNDLIEPGPAERDAPMEAGRNRRSEG
jgi:hypothetical protein